MTVAPERPAARRIAAEMSLLVNPGAAAEMDRAKVWAQRWEQLARLAGIQRGDLAHLWRLTMPGRQLLAHFLLAFRGLGQQHGAGLPVPDRRLAQVGQRVDEPGICAGSGACKGVPVLVLHPGGPGADDPGAGRGRAAEGF